MADLFIVQVRLKFTLKLTAVAVLLGGLATLWFHSQLEYEVGRNKFLLSAIVTGALAVAWVGMGIFYLFAKHTVTPGYGLTDRIDALPWWVLKILVAVLVIGGGWFLIARYADQAGDAFDLVLEERFEVLANRLQADPALIQSVDAKTGLTLVQMAFRHDKPEAVALLLESGASGMDLTDGGISPIVASFDRPEMLSVLLEGGFDPNQPDRDGMPPVHHAVAMGATEPLVVLFAAGADIEGPDRTRRTPLIRAIENDDVVVAELLLDRGAQINAFDQRGDTPLHKAVRRGNVDSARFLLERGADQKIFNFAHIAPIHIAAASGEAGELELLLEAGDVANLVGESDLSPLDHTLKGREYDLAETLIEAGADVDRIRADGDTALRRAILIRDYRTARFLIRQGADPDVPNHDGQTAMDLIQQKELAGLIELLEQRTAEAFDSP